MNELVPPELTSAERGPRGPVQKPCLTLQGRFHFNEVPDRPPAMKECDVILIPLCLPPSSWRAKKTKTFNLKTGGGQATNFT